MKDVLHKLFLIVDGDFEYLQFDCLAVVDAFPNELKVDY
jgi:hypothetical protein